MKKSFIILALAAFSLCPSQMKAQQNPHFSWLSCRPGDNVQQSDTPLLYLFHHRRHTSWGGYTYQCFSSADLKEWRDEGERCSMPRTVR